MTFIYRIAAPLFTLTLLLPLSTALAGSTQKTITENNDRQVDQAAMASQDNAIKKLAGLLKKYRGTRQEPVFLFKLAELQGQGASIKFRISHGEAHRSQASLNMSGYRSAMKQSIQTLSELIAKYPHYLEIPQAFFMRGKAYEEIEDKTQATRDYLHLVRTYPEAPENIQAYMSLAEFSIAANDHSKAVSYLKEVEKHPEDNHYPFALYKLAWAHYNLQKINEALSYAKKHIAYYNQLSAEQITTSDRAFKENMLLDSIVFYMEGQNRNSQPGLEIYTTAKALEYFRDLDHSGSLGKILLRYGKLLRSNGLDQDLISWKNQILNQEHARPESLELLTLTFEHQNNRRRYSQMVDTTRNLVALHQKHPEFENYPKAQKQLLDSAQELQTLIVKNKKAEGVQELSQTLAQIYQAFTLIVPETDPRVARVHYNLAETLFQIKSFEESVAHYRWIVTHIGSDKKIEYRELQDSALKAVSARYESLQEKKLIPKELTARALSPDQATPPLLGEWITWLDELLGKNKKAPSEELQNFYFEGNRALYAAGLNNQATERMTEFALTYPNSKNAIPSASLVVDTLIASQLWERNYKTILDLLEKKPIETSPFGKKAFLVAADSFYKMIEQAYAAKEYKEVLSLTKKFISIFGTTPRESDVLYLAAQSATELDESIIAYQYYSTLIQKDPHSQAAGPALLSRAKIHQAQLKYAQSAKDYAQFLAMDPIRKQKLKPKEIETLRVKALTLAWLSGDLALLKQQLSLKDLCTGAEIESETKETCDQFHALSALKAPQTLDTQMEHARERAKKGNAVAIALWSAALLEKTDELDFRERLSLIRHFSKNYSELDGLQKVAVLPYVSKSIVRSVSLNRQKLGEYAPLRANEKHITRRIEAIREIENATTAAMKLPWAKVRATVLNELASVYQDLARSLRDLPAPKSLPEEEIAAYQESIQKVVLPFEEKANDMRTKAFELAAEFQVDPAAFSSILEPYFQDNPSLAKRLRPQAIDGKEAKLPQARAFDTATLSTWISLTQDLNINKLKAASSVEDFEPKAGFLFQWTQAFKDQNLPLAVHLVQEAETQKLLTPATLKLLQAYSLALSGNQAEALTLIEMVYQENKNSENSDLKKLAKVGGSLHFFLLQNAYAALNRIKANTLLADLDQTRTPATTSQAAGRLSPEIAAIALWATQGPSKAQ